MCVGAGPIGLDQKEVNQINHGLGEGMPVKDWVSVQTSIHLISISLSSLPLSFLIYASICCCQSLSYYYLLQECDSVASALLPETEVAFQSIFTETNEDNQNEWRLGSCIQTNQMHDSL